MKLFKKIDLFYEGKYLCSTNVSKTCKEAKAKYITNLTYYKENSGINPFRQSILDNPEKLKAYFDKGERQ